jgi:hypothetical protein|tara:strand:+ start:5390 stop:5764 length:375 start_codon:yes stop_codon:yes gene_type:complete
MLLTIFALILGFVLVLTAIGFFSDPPNPYLILVASIFLLLLSFSFLAEGLEIRTGTNSTATATISSNINQTQSNTTTTEIIKTDFFNFNTSNIRGNGFFIVLLLLSFYLGWFSIGLIIESNRGL